MYSNCVYWNDIRRNVWKMRVLAPIDFSILHWKWCIFYNETQKYIQNRYHLKIVSYGHDVSILHIILLKFSFSFLWLVHSEHYNTKETNIRFNWIPRVNKKHTIYYVYEQTLAYSTKHKFLKENWIIKLCFMYSFCLLK